MATTTRRTNRPPDDTGGGGGGGGTPPTSGVQGPWGGSPYDLPTKYFPKGGSYGQGDTGPAWPGMGLEPFEQTPGVVARPSGGAFGAYEYLGQLGPTEEERAAASHLMQVNPTYGLSAAEQAYRDMFSGRSTAGGAEGWLAAKAKDLYDNPGYSATEKGDIANAQARALQSQIGGAKDEIIRRSSRSGNPMAAYNALATAGQGSSAAMADMERQNRIRFADEARGDKFRAMSELAPTVMQAEAERQRTGAAGMLGTAGQRFGQGTQFAKDIQDIYNSQWARRAAGASGLAGLYGQDAGTQMQMYELLAKLMGTPVATTTSGTKQG